ncbi:MAG: class I SAM-dependent methyltransferase [Gemmataceae bacterium]|nr:class I SAM-dependent methyltransferase [Gemmataceae bacterium]
MAFSLADLVVRALPAKLRERLGWKLLRSCSGEYQAFTHLFVPPYQDWVEWLSGLGRGVHLLYGLARALEPEVIVEIGSARGRSTCTLALACRQNGRGKVYAIDPHTINDWTDRGVEATSLQFLRTRLRADGLEPWCEVLVQESRAVARTWSKPIDLLFIDGDHSFEGVRADFEAFQPWLKESGFVVFHDTAWEYYKNHAGYRQDMGVPRYLETLRSAGYESITASTWPGITILCPRVGGFVFQPTEQARDTKKLFAS